MQRQEMPHVQQQGVHRLAQRTTPSVPQQRELTVRDVITRHSNFESTGVQVKQAVVRRDPIVIYTNKPVQSSTRPVYISQNQRTIIRRQQLIQHAQPHQQKQHQNRSGSQQSDQNEPPRVLQQVQQLQRQVKSPLVKQQRTVLAPITRIQPNPKIQVSRKRSAATPENAENHRYSPLETTPNQARDNTDWQVTETTEPSQKSAVHEKVNNDGCLPDYVRNIGGFEIRVIRSKDPDMRLFPC